MKNLIFLLLLIPICCIFSGCSCNRNKDNKIDTPKIEKKVTIKISRYDKALFSVNKKDMQNELKKIKPKFSFFLDGDLDDKQNIKQLSDYLNDPQMIKNYEAVQKQFSDLTWLEKELSDEMSCFAYYFPDRKIPQVYAYISGMDFENPAIYADSVLCIALDMYLGKDYQLYSAFGLPAFIRSGMTKEYIARDCAEAIAKYYAYQDMKDATCLDQMVYNGKMMLFTDALLPETADSIKMKYSKKQLDWCNTNESKMWAFFIDNKMLYNKDYGTYMKFFNDSPFTNAFGKDSPPRTGTWVGWQIVRDYIRNSGQVNLKKLNSVKDAQEILRISKYKPKKP
jgi:hypothetical protein